MDPAAPVASSSRFVSEKSIVEAQERRKEEWKKAYERLGQKPPEDEGPPAVYDPRTLYEKLKEKKDQKQAAFDEKYSIRNQFRSLEDDEISFLDSVLDDKKLAERERKREIEAELAKFRQAVNAKVEFGSPPLPGLSSSPPPNLAGKSSASPSAPSSMLPAGPSSSESKSTSSAKPLPPPSKKSSLPQKGLLAGAIKRKSSGGDGNKDKKKLLNASSKPVTSVKPETATAQSASKADDGADTEESASKKARVE